MLVGFAFPPQMLALQPGDGMRWWQYLTYAFAHGSVAHLLVNMIALLGFGHALERSIGRWNMLGVLTACVLAGGLAVTTQPMIGMSAGIFGLIAFYALDTPWKRVWLVVIPMEALDVLIICFVLSLVGLYGNWLPNVGHAAHLVGMSVGSLCWVRYRYVRRKD
jgi:membrane associated rhomboid family serine protease